MKTPNATASPQGSPGEDRECAALGSTTGVRSSCAAAAVGGVWDVTAGPAGSAALGTADGRLDGKVDCSGMPAGPNAAFPGGGRVSSGLATTSGTLAVKAATGSTIP
jgi:hypothetical protein